MLKKEFYDGQCFDAYQYFGAHKTKGGYVFRTYAPKAKKIAIIGDFTSWQEAYMEREKEYGVFSLTLKEAEVFQLYKYRIYSTDTEWVEHCDPYGFQMELRPACCSIITDLDTYKFSDNKWMQSRNDCMKQPMNIYEMHLGSWRRNPNDENEWYRYDEIADLLIPYLLENHYTHVEFMPLAEYPFDGSWGYQNTGFFAPTSRYGTPQQLMQLVDQLHQASIGAILDMVPVHFAIDSYGLKQYDGTELYEYPHRDIGRSEWGSFNFNLSKGEVRSFLQSSANYWLEEYHFDGLRIDAVSRLIYWQGDEKRGQNGPGLIFIRDMNTGLKKLHPSAMLIAEDSSVCKGVTAPCEQGGLGYDYKWDLGWMHDTLTFFKTPPEYRSRDYHKLTFSMQYFQYEKFLLMFSHDENVHGKATILQKMYGDYDIKFPQARALYLYMMAHPGKKLNFMGNEIGQLREWSETEEQDWKLLKYPIHDSFHRYMIDLNRLYQESGELHDDYAPDNFRWLDCHQEERCIYSFERGSGDQFFAVVLNLSNQHHTGYSLVLDQLYEGQLLLHSDWEKYGGQTNETQSVWSLAAEKMASRLTLEIPPYSGMLFRFHKAAQPEQTKNQPQQKKKPATGSRKRKAAKK